MLWMRLADYMAPIDENAQQEPQLPWDLTEVILPLAVQLTPAVTLIAGVELVAVVVVLVGVLAVAYTLILRLGAEVPRKSS